MTPHPAFADPKTRLDAFIKVEGDQSGAEVVQYGAGSIYSFFDGRADRKLFDTEAFAVRRYRRIDGGWLRLHREVAVYRDPATGKIINTWYNPYLERDVDVIDIYQEFNRQYLVADLGRTFDIGISAHGDDAHLHRNFFISRRAELQPTEYPLHGQDPTYDLSEYHNYFCRFGELMSADVVNAAAVGSTNSVCSYLPWLELGSVPGFLVFHMRSKKLATVAEMPADLVAYVSKRYPTYLAAPTEFKPNDLATTGLNFYKTIIDSKRKAAH